MHDVLISSPLSIFVLGALVLAFIYHLVLYFFSKDKLVIHYLLYLIGAVLLTYWYCQLNVVFFGEITADYLYFTFNEAIQILYLAFYFNFILQAVEVGKEKSKFLYKSWLSVMIILFFYAVFITSLKKIAPDYSIKYFFVGIRIFIFIITLLMLYRCYKLRELTFQRYILYGCTVYYFFGLASFIAQINLDENMAVFPPEWLIIGTFVDVIFFSIAISYRNKKIWESLNLQLLNDANDLILLQNQVLQKQTELEKERARIAADMHDDLGSGLTTITYLSQMAKDDLTIENLSKIKKTSTDLIENMSEIIWATRDENNTLDELISKIKRYAVDYLDDNKIELQFSTSELENNNIISGENRRNLYLGVKESLKNIVKHSKATKVVISIQIEKEFVISIQDNGIGFRNTPEKLLVGNGFKNMKRRIESINGNFYFVSDSGTLIVFSILYKDLIK
jgi:signal transduction histidine kinase